MESLRKEMKKARESKISSWIDEVSRKMDEVKGLEFINLKTNKEEFNCEWCNQSMTEEDHHFCDICDNCREDNEIN